MSQKLSCKKTAGMLAVAVIVLSAMFAACTSGSGQDDILEIKFWAMGREGEIVPELLNEFERENPGVVSSSSRFPGQRPMKNC
jgi:multiple sugar transport system substrate-binding protein